MEPSAISELLIFYEQRCDIISVRLFEPEGRLYFLLIRLVGSSLNWFNYVLTFGMVALRCRDHSLIHLVHYFHGVNKDVNWLCVVRCLAVFSPSIKLLGLVTLPIFGSLIKRSCLSSDLAATEIEIERLLC